MEIKQVKSSNLEAIGYDGATKTLRIIFKTGSVYDYLDVNDQVYAALITSPSVGKFFHANIKNQYKFLKR